ncbi:hypothetical protein GCM10009116_18020 [Brevundimonas basaltis]|uniref:Helix-hairpin-helix motif protein n=1 Tax=Brevundimonas basaltis TaxID=472166 RepID=A0A7W8HXR1_9CAUL|nr:hypothetical protein [Brevundimonas basaltis]MBB5290890.1 hypothetical protein [Brevundimonas basaltis]
MTQQQTVYLNLASAGDLASIDQIGEQAATIVEHRPFQDWSDLRRAGLNQDEINGLKSAGIQLGAPGEGPIGEPGSGGSGGSPRGNLGQA